MNLFESIKSNLNESTKNFDLPKGYPQEIYDAYFEYCDDIDLVDDEPLDFTEWYAKEYSKNESESTIDYDLIKYLLDEFEYSNEFPTYEDIRENYYGAITKSEYNSAIEIADRCKDIPMYNGNLELSSNHTLFELANLDDEYSEYSEDVYATYNQFVEDAVRAFEADTGVELFGDGRSGRHIVVKDTIENRINYEELKAKQEELEAQVVDNTNRYIEALNNGKDTSFAYDYAIRSIDSLNESVEELEPRFDSRASFYGKAKVDTNGDEYTLISYQTPILKIKDGNIEVLCDESALSQTTMRHVRDFLKQMDWDGKINLSGKDYPITKKWLMAKKNTMQLDSEEYIAVSTTDPQNENTSFDNKEEAIKYAKEFNLDRVVKVNTDGTEEAIWDRELNESEETSSLRKALDKLVSLNDINYYTINKLGDGFEVIINYPVYDVDGTDRSIFPEEDSISALYTAVIKSRDALADDFYGALQGENDFYFYNSEKELKDRIAAEELKLTEIAESINNSKNELEMMESDHSGSFDIYTLTKNGNEHTSSLYNTVEDEEQANDIVAELKAQGINAYVESKKPNYVMFYLNDKELGGHDLANEFDGERESARELFAEENNVKPEDIEVRLIYKESEVEKDFVLSVDGKNPVKYSVKDMSVEEAKKDYLANEGTDYKEEDITVEYLNESTNTKRYAVNIDWETDGDETVKSKLPTKVEIPANYDAEQIADYLSDTYGWLVNSLEVLDESEESSMISLMAYGKVYYMFDKDEWNNMSDEERLNTIIDVADQATEEEGHTVETDEVEVLTESEKLKEADSNIIWSSEITEDFYDKDWLEERYQEYVDDFDGTRKALSYEEWLDSEWLENYLYYEFNNEDNEYEDWYSFINNYDEETLKMYYQDYLDDLKELDPEEPISFEDWKENFVIDDSSNQWDILKDDLEENIYPMIDKQINNDILFVVGDYNSNYPDFRPSGKGGKFLNKAEDILDWLNNNDRIDFNRADNGTIAVSSYNHDGSITGLLYTFPNDKDLLYKVAMETGYYDEDRNIDDVLGEFQYDINHNNIDMSDFVGYEENFIPIKTDW